MVAVANLPQSAITELRHNVTAELPNWRIMENLNSVTV